MIDAHRGNELRIATSHINNREIMDHPRGATWQRDCVIKTDEFVENNKEKIVGFDNPLGFNAFEGTPRRERVGAGGMTTCMPMIDWRHINTFRLRLLRERHTPNFMARYHVTSVENPIELYSLLIKIYKIQVYMKVHNKNTLN